MIKKVKTNEAARLMSEQYNVSTRHKHMSNEVRFSFYNHHEIVKAFKSGRAIDMIDAPKHKDEPILIIGSGPSLDATLPLLKDWQGDIMTSTSQATTCIYWGKEPKYIVALDPDSHKAELKADTWKDRDCTLILHPGVTPDLIEFWKGKMYLFRKLQPQTPFYDNAQKIGYSSLGKVAKSKYADLGVKHLGDGSEIFIRAQVPMLACVLAAQICIAKQLGYKRLFLLGADLGFPGEQSRFTEWNYIKNKWIEKKPYSMDRQAKCEDPLIETENGTLSTKMMIFYSHQIVTAWRITETDIINTSKDSIIRVFPYIPFEKILSKQGRNIKGFNTKQIIKTSEEHLARQNVYFLYVGKGLMPHEFKDPLHEIPLMLNKVKESLKQQGREKDLDIDANMKRIKKLFNEIAKVK